MRLLVFAMLLGLIGQAHACSLNVSHEFRISAGTAKPKPPVEVEIKSVTFTPSMGADDSCEGVGLIVVELSGRPWRRLKQQGFYVRPVVGVNDPRVFPEKPLAPDEIARDYVAVSWDWVQLTPDKDGHIRWRFEVVPVSPSGVLGTPVPVCVATDESCSAAQSRPDDSSKPKPLRQSA
jgi:hypothetical protein